MSYDNHLFWWEKYSKLPYIPVLGLRVNDVGKICPFSMLRRMTCWTTFVVRPTLDSLPLGLQNFLKFDDQIQHYAFLTEFFKNSYLPVCAHSRISSRTKVDQLEQLYKIPWKTPMLTHITLVNEVRVYGVTSGNFFLPKILSENFLFIFTLFSYSRSIK